MVEGLGEGESVVSVAVLLSCLRVLMPFFLSCSLLGEYDCLSPGDPRLEWSFSAKKVISKRLSIDFFLIRIDKLVGIDNNLKKYVVFFNHRYL